MGQPVRRQGYKRRGSVTRYSIVAQNTVVDEYKKHEDVINQFRRDSIKIEGNMKNLSLDDTQKSDGSNSNIKSKGPRRRRPRKQQVDENGNPIQRRFFRRGR